jgi:hypothetical protein
MSISTCYPCAKYLLLVLNLLFWLSGAALIVLGVLSLLRPEVQHVIHLFNLNSLLLPSIEISACIIILAGILIFLIGLFGLCGAKRESRTCLILYIVLVTCVLLTELALFTYIALYHEQWHILIKEHLVSQTKKYNHEYSSQYERAVNYIQSKYQCCGINSAYDYSNPLIPTSCCSKINTTSCSIQQVDLSGTPGCFRLLTNEIFFWGKYFILFELGLCLLGFIGILLAICVCQNTMFYDGYTQPPYHI